jgi:hypothetical protein
MMVAVQQPNGADGRHDITESKENPKLPVHHRRKALQLLSSAHTSDWSPYIVTADRDLWIIPSHSRPAMLWSSN